MQECWYGDNRDLIKWATLAHLREKHRIQTIIQVVYCGATTARPSVSYGADSFKVSDTVWNHFRSLSNIRRLGEEINVRIELVDDKFDQRDRAAYISRIQSAVQQSASPRLLFLDPDTGLAPSKCGSQHVTSNELRRLWGFLGPEDWLVLYQHARHKKDWVDEVFAEFRLALLNAQSLHVFRCNDRGFKGVVFLAAQKRV
jgi:hypothetical protein